MPRTALSLFCLTIGCTAPQAPNATPGAEITSHAAPAEVLEGHVALLQGTVSDSDHPTSALLAAWYLGSEEACAPAAPDASGTTRCDILIPAGADSVTLEVRDPRDAAGSHILPLTVLPSDPPEARIVSPAVDGTHYTAHPISFSGILSDSEDSPDALVAYWESVGQDGF